MEKRIHPQLRAVLSTMPQEKFTREGLATIRADMDQLFVQTPQADASVTVYNLNVPGPHDAPEVRLRIYEPASKTSGHSGVLYIHGGGYILGTPEMTDAGCRLMVTEIDCIVVSVDYRLAPEHPFPAPLDDCYAALQWFSTHAEELGVDASRIAVAGASAGGGLTAALCLLARDRKGPDIIFQAPLCPMLDDRNNTPSSYEFTDPRVWNREKNIFAWEAYLGSGNKEDVSPYAAAARAEDLSGLPPMYTYVGELDLFRDETIDYAARLMRAGVPAEIHVYPGCFHAFEMFTQIADISLRAQNEWITVLKSGLKKSE